MTRIVRRPVPRHRLPSSLHPVARRVLAARGVTSGAELDRSLGRLHSFKALGGIGKAARLLAQAIEAQERILVVGDFDADGATASALAVEALRLFGARHVDYLVPNRFDFGYGLTPELVQVMGEAELLITVDNGIASLEGVEAAKARGMKVIITDHHLPGPRLPAADAIVNPNLAQDPFPSKALAGVGVVFYVMAALRALLRETGRIEGEGPRLADFLDLVALGTVADVVPLDLNNRILVHQGLMRMRAGHCRPGIRALAEASGKALQRLSAQDLAFALGPRLNAAGRLEDMSIGIACLLSRGEEEARERARRLDGLNRERRTIEGAMLEQALARLEGALPFGLCLFDPSWPQGVIGILAARIRERFHRPAIAFAPGAEGEVKGSARSVPGLHIRDAIAAVAARHPGLVGRFGGHAMAAGLSLKGEHIEPFARAFDEEVRRHLREEDLQGVIESDGELAAEDFSLALAEALEGLGPWGQGFPEPLFDGVFAIHHARAVGEGHLYLRLAPPGGHPVPAIAFRTPLRPWMEQGARVRAAYRLGVDVYQGQRSLKLYVQHLEPAGA